MPGRNQYKAEQFIAAIEDSGGIISTIARRVGCDWHTAKKYIDEYATVNRAYLDECERVLDLAESKTIELINEKDGAMIRYYLSTKGRKRGYTEKQQVEHVGNKDEPVQIEHTIDLSKLTDDQLAKLESVVASLAG